MDKTKIELLAPAKDVQIGIDAINHGADAVYIGGPSFGAREKAANPIADIEKLCRHASRFDARVYVTLNTILYDDELEQARRIAYDCWNAGADALIVQDMALLQIDMPPIALHASTQCNNMTLEKVKFLEEVGFNQVVLGRELSLEQIHEIRRQTTIPLEFFVHGALCVCQNGQCYMSQQIGGRSANRGACAQPCRLPWNLVDDKGNVMIANRHLLSLKDLNNSRHLEELADAGISSFKIEGRMKEADYVKNITAYYRQQLDKLFTRRPDFEPASRGRCTCGFEANPEKSFSRGFTDYFINGRQPNIGSPYTPKSMGEYIGTVSRLSRTDFDVNTTQTLHNGDGLCFLDADKNLQGLRVDVVRGNRVQPNKMNGLFNGAEIYRNYDIVWQKQVDNSKGSRQIDIELTLGETPNGYELIGKVDGFELSEQTDSEKIVATNPEKADDSIRRKMMQWGDTIFNPTKLAISFAKPYFIQASVLGTLKRNLAGSLANALEEQHRNSRPQFMKKGTEFPIAQLDYTFNVANAKAEEFYRECGATTLQGCPEVEHQSRPIRVMRTKHCIRYSNGLCPKQTGKPTPPLFIENEKGRFRLEFDCVNCVMEIFEI